MSEEELGYGDHAVNCPHCNHRHVIYVEPKGMDANYSGEIEHECKSCKKEFFTRVVVDVTLVAFKEQER